MLLIIRMDFDLAFLELDNGVTEQSLREDLVLKDRTYLKLKAKVASVNNIIKGIREWREHTKKLKSELELERTQRKNVLEKYIVLERAHRELNSTYTKQRNELTNCIAIKEVNKQQEIFISTLNKEIKSLKDEKQKCLLSLNMLKKNTAVKTTENSHYKNLLSIGERAKDAGLLTSNEIMLLQKPNFHSCRTSDTSEEAKSDNFEFGNMSNICNSVDTGRASSLEISEDDKFSVSSCTPDSLYSSSTCGSPRMDIFELNKLKHFQNSNLAVTEKSNNECTSTSNPAHMDSVIITQESMSELNNKTNLLQSVNSFDSGINCDNKDMRANKISTRHVAIDPIKVPTLDVGVSCTILDDVQKRSFTDACMSPIKFPEVLLNTAENMQTNVCDIETPFSISLVNAVSPIKNLNHDKELPFHLPVTEQVLVDNFTDMSKEFDIQHKTDFENDATLIESSNIQNVETVDKEVMCEMSADRLTNTTDRLDIIRDDSILMDKEVTRILEDTCRFPKLISPIPSISGGKSPGTLRLRRLPRGRQVYRSRNSLVAHKNSAVLHINVINKLKSNIDILKLKFNKMLRKLNEKDNYNKNKFLKLMNIALRINLQKGCNHTSFCEDNSITYTSDSEVFKANSSTKVNRTKFEHKMDTISRDDTFNYCQYNIKDVDDKRPSSDLKKLKTVKFKKNKPNMNVSHKEFDTAAICKSNKSINIMALFGSDDSASETSSIGKPADIEETMCPSDEISFDLSVGSNSSHDKLMICKKKRKLGTEERQNIKISSPKQARIQNRKSTSTSPEARRPRYCLRSSFILNNAKNETHKEKEIITDKMASSTHVSYASSKENDGIMHLRSSLRLKTAREGNLDSNNSPKKPRLSDKESMLSFHSNKCEVEVKNSNLLGTNCGKKKKSKKIPTSRSVSPDFLGFDSTQSYVKISNQKYNYVDNQQTTKNQIQNYAVTKENLKKDNSQDMNANSPTALTVNERQSNTPPSQKGKKNQSDTSVQNCNKELSSSLFLYNDREIVYRAINSLSKLKSKNLATIIPVRKTYTKKCISNASTRVAHCYNEKLTNSEKQKLETVIVADEVANDSKKIRNLVCYADNVFDDILNVDQPSPIQGTVRKCTDDYVTSLNICKLAKPAIVLNVNQPSAIQDTVRKCTNDNSTSLNNSKASKPAFVLNVDQPAAIQDAVGKCTYDDVTSLNNCRAIKPTNVLNVNQPSLIQDTVRKCIDKDVTSLKNCKRTKPANVLNVDQPSAIQDTVRKYTNDNDTSLKNSKETKPANVLNADQSSAIQDTVSKYTNDNDTSLKNSKETKPANVLNVDLSSAIQDTVGKYTNDNDTSLNNSKGAKPANVLNVNKSSAIQDTVRKCTNDNGTSLNNSKATKQANVLNVDKPSAIQNTVRKCTNDVTSSNKKATKSANVSNVDQQSLIQNTIKTCTDDVKSLKKRKVKKSANVLNINQSSALRDTVRKCTNDNGTSLNNSKRTKPANVLNVNKPSVTQGTVTKYKKDYGTSLNNSKGAKPANVLNIDKPSAIQNTVKKCTNDATSLNNCIATKPANVLNVGQPSAIQEALRKCTDDDVTSLNNCKATIPAIVLNVDQPSLIQNTVQKCTDDDVTSLINCNATKPDNVLNVNQPSVIQDTVRKCINDNGTSLNNSKATKPANVLNVNQSSLIQNTVKKCIDNDVTSLKNCKTTKPANVVNVDQPSAIQNIVRKCTDDDVASLNNCKGTKPANVLNVGQLSAIQDTVRKCTKDNGTSLNNVKTAKPANVKPAKVRNHTVFCDTAGNAREIRDLVCYSDDMFDDILNVNQPSPIQDTVRKCTNDEGTFFSNCEVTKPANDQGFKSHSVFREILQAFAGEINVRVKDPHCGKSVKHKNRTLSTLEHKINSYVDNSLSNFPVNTLCDMLEAEKPKHIAWAMIKFIASDKRANDVLCKTYTPPVPPMLKTEQYLVLCVKELQSRSNFFCGGSFLNLLLDGIEYNIFRLNKDTLTACQTERVVHFYAVLCRMNNLPTRLRHFIIDALYCLQYKAIGVVLNIINVWSHIIPMSTSKAAQSPLIKVIVYSLHYFKVQKKEFHGNVNFESIREILFKRYKYKMGNFSEVRLLNILKDCITGITLCSQEDILVMFILVAKRHGVQWCHKHIVQEILMPLLSDHSASQHSRLLAIKLIGPILRPYPVHMKTHCEVVTTKLSSILFDSDSREVEEAVVGSLFYLRRHCFMLLADIFMRWEPKYPPSQLVKNQLRAFVGEKPIAVWKKTLATMSE